MNRRQIIAVGAGALAPLLVGGAFGAHAQPMMDSMKLSILAGGDFATMTSRLALKRGGSAVANFAKLEIEEQMAVAEAFGSKPGAAGLTPKQSAMLAELEATPDADFDAMYVKGQIMGHQELLTLHRSYSNRGKDPMAVGAATVAVPSIKTHLALLNGIRAAA